MANPWIRAWFVLLAVASVVFADPPVELPDVEVLEGHPVRTVLPPDAIPALDGPVHVIAAAADFMDAAESVLGVVVGGEARAYPLALLDWHEVVNDDLGGRSIAATW